MSPVERGYVLPVLQVAASHPAVLEARSAHPSGRESTPLPPGANVAAIEAVEWTPPHVRERYREGGE